MSFYDVIRTYRWEEIAGEIGRRSRRMWSGRSPPAAPASTIC